MTVEGTTRRSEAPPSAEASGPGRAWRAAPRSSPSSSGGWAPARSWTGSRLTTAWALAAAVAITSLTTLCCAWRWSLVAGGLGVDVPLRTAVGAYYRSQFLNSTLPGGVLGDVHRGVRHGRAVGDLGRGLRSVAWERASGQAVQALLTVAVLLLLAPPAGPLLRLVVAWVAVAAVAGVALVVVLLRLNPAAPSDPDRARRHHRPPRRGPRRGGPGRASCSPPPSP